MEIRVAFTPVASATFGAWRVVDVVPTYGAATSGTEATLIAKWGTTQTMTVTLRPPANTFAAFAKGSNASASARESASRDDEASSAAAPAGTREGARRAVSKAVTYDRKTLFELRDANARVTSELPVELATSALEIVKNELNAAIAREQERVGEASDETETGGGV